MSVVVIVTAFPVPEHRAEVIAAFETAIAGVPISNPTSKIEAMPSDVLAWSQGKALVGSVSRSHQSTTTG